MIADTPAAQAATPTTAFRAEQGAQGNLDSFPRVPCDPCGTMLLFRFRDETAIGYYRATSAG